MPNPESSIIKFPLDLSAVILISKSDAPSTFEGSVNDSYLILSKHQMHLK